MGRYIYSEHNSIDGYKFWFGVQSSDSPERFGAHEVNSDVTTYEISDKELIESEIDKIKKTLGSRKKLFDDFFSKVNIYNKDELYEYMKSSLESYTKDEFTKDLSDYADLDLGEKLLKALNNSENGYVEFDAE